MSRDLAHTFYAKITSDPLDKLCYLAPTLHHDDVFPRVECWNERKHLLQVIVVYDNLFERKAAEAHALYRAQLMREESPACDVLACVVSPLMVVEIVEETAGV
jgi:hypothetical protein